MTVPTPPVPIVPPIPHPSSLALSQSVFDALASDIVRLVRLSPADYWCEHCLDEPTRAAQNQAREDSKEEPNAPARRTYHPVLFIYNDPTKVDEALRSVQAEQAHLNVGKAGALPTMRLVDGEAEHAEEPRRRMVAGQG